MAYQLSDIISPNSILAYWNDNPNNQSGNYVHNQLFPDSYAGKTKSVDQVLGKSNKLTGMTQTAPDANVTYKNNDGFNIRSYRVIDYKNAKRMDESRLSDIQEAIAKNSSPAILNAISKTQLDDSASLLEDAEYEREKRAMEALTTGQIVANDAIRDFGVPTEHFMNPKTKWGTKDSKAVADIKAAVKQMKNDNNTTLTTAIMNQNTLDMLSRSGDLMQSIGIGKVSNTFAIAQSTVASQFKALTGLNIALYDTADFMPDGKVILVPDGSLGNLMWTNTNEELGGLAGMPGVQFSTTSSGIALAMYKTMDPTGTIAKVSQSFLPVLNKSENIVIMNVGSEQDVNATNAEEFTFGRDNITSSDSSNSNNGSNSNQSQAKSDGSKSDDSSSDSKSSKSDDSSSDSKSSK